MKDLMPQGTSCPYNSAGYPGLCATANTSPYDYVTTVLFPQCATVGNCSVNGNQYWGADCTGNSCYGVPLYREQTNPGETGPTEIRMMTDSTYQRSNLTVNNARYYIDTTVSAATQSPWCTDNNQLHEWPNLPHLLQRLRGQHAGPVGAVLCVSAVCQAHHQPGVPALRGQGLRSQHAAGGAGEPAGQSSSVHDGGSVSVPQEGLLRRPAPAS